MHGLLLPVTVTVICISVFIFRPVSKRVTFMKKVMVIVSLMMLFVSSAYAQKLSLFTEDDPPYSFKDKDSKPAGFGVDVVMEIQKRIKSEHPIQVVPWARAYKLISDNKPNTVVFSMSRTKEREALFHWVGPIVENDWVFIGKKGSGVKITSLDDAKALAGIGTVRDYAWTNYLLNQGFKNLDDVTSRKQNVLKLNAGRFSTFVSADSSYKSEIIENGFNPDDYEILLRFKTIQMYIAFSKATDRQVVNRWQSALDEMKKDGAFVEIHNKWLPENKIPGIAKVPK